VEDFHFVKEFSLFNELKTVTQCEKLFFYSLENTDFEG
jgi:hypothetical protein